MLSVIIATRDSERPLVRTLAALVPGATAGLSPKSWSPTPDRATIPRPSPILPAASFSSRTARWDADCRRQRQPRALRGFYFCSRESCSIPLGSAKAKPFVERPQADVRAAVFRRGAPAQSALGEAASLLAGALGPRPRPEQGLIISKRFYRNSAAIPSTPPTRSRLLRRIGRRRIAILSTRRIPT